MAKIRTFFAVNLSSKIRANASRLIDKMVVTGADYNWVAEANLHITLNFVGDVPENEVTDLCIDFRKTLEGSHRFMIAISGIGAFPNLDAPRTIWLGITEGAEELTELNRRLADLLARWRFSKDRNEFHPHLTLGRLRRGGRWNQSLTELLEKHRFHDSGMCSIEEVVVNSSYLERSGPTYTPMTRVKLV